MLRFNQGSVPREEKFISVVIPNRNGESTLAESIEAALSSEYGNFEVIVVDDGSTDSSLQIAKSYPVKLVELGGHRGVSEARNTGAKESEGEIVLFIDGDCLLRKEVLERVNTSFDGWGKKVVGGTYTPLPPDEGFFSIFQSLYVNYAETEKATDYIATHAMAIRREDFLASGGFLKDSAMGHTTSIEDVEFSHRLRKRGFELELVPELQVAHIFNFNFSRAMKNAFKKSHYWTLYSMRRGDLLGESGAASSELKLNSLIFVAAVASVASGALPLLIPLNIFNAYQSRRLLSHFQCHKGWGFTLASALYFFFLYPLPVLAGGFTGLAKYIMLRLSGRI